VNQVKGLTIIKRNAHLKAEEIGFLLKNNVDSKFARSLGNLIVVEYENWSRKAGVNEINGLIIKMTSY